MEVFVKLVCIGILLSFVLSFAQISVEVKDEQPYNPSMLGLRARVVNNSGQSYDNVTVNILLKKSPSETFALDAYYTEGWNCSIAEQSGEYLVIKMVIPHLGTGISPNESGVSLGIHHADNWQPLSKTSENGFPSGIAFTTALNYSVYQGDVLIGGSSFIDPSSVVSSLRFVGLQPVNNSDGSIPAWIEIENYGTTPADLSNMTLEWPTSMGTASSVVSSAVLQPGKRLRICAVQVDCPDDDVVASVPLLPMGSIGEILLYYNAVALDYLSWGSNAGVLAANAREANIQYTRIRMEPGYADEFWHAVWDGIFYKKIDGQWFSYRTEEYDVNTTNRPGPITYMNEETLCMDGSNPPKVKFAWHPVEGAIGYNLTVKKSDGTVVFSQFVHRVSRKIELGAGTYYWNVRAVFWKDRYAVDNPWMDHYLIWKTKTITMCTDITNEVYLQAPQYGVHKDTRMLVPNWGELAEFPEISWDHPDVFVYGLTYDYSIIGSFGNPLFYEVDSRCWAVATQILNAFYHGNLTQDEIKYYGKTVGFENVWTVFGTYSRPERDKIIGPFALGLSGVGYLPEIKMLLKWALNIDDSQLEHGAFGDGPFDQTFVMEHIDQNRPIYFMEKNHFMIVDGYRFSSGDFQVHLVNLYNGGEVEWVSNQDRHVRAYFVPIDVTHPRMSDIRVHIDSDNDGIVDFDEIERFHTNPYSKDSDGDGIEDKVEIFSYTIKEPFIKTMQCTDPMNYTSSYDLKLGDYIDEEVGTICRLEVYADIDGDGKRAEKDVDSDHPNNDGLPDGAEDLNNNGYVDNGETDPYNIADDGGATGVPSEKVEITEWDIPELVAIYTFEELNVGDNVTCNSGMHGYCRVASESALQYYAVSLGHNSTIGDVFSKGGVQLRNDAHVVGDVSVYSLPNASITPDIYQNASVTGETSVHTLGEWPYVVSDNAYHSLEGKENWADLTVHPGQTVSLSVDVAYRNLKVEAGGTLKLGAGTIMVGNITMEWGSRLEFTNPGRETLLIVDGYINWMAQIVNSDLQTVAKGFKLIEYAPGYIHIEGDWAGTIFARWSELTLGQVKKTAYGSFVAKKVYLGNGLTIYRVHFSPIPLTDLV